ncbi:MAG: hypothetical protein JNL67_22590 [Planctomycetaceae bacterium]|nr:hypothetical protein [Planctomycetaceae bacterium]
MKKHLILCFVGLSLLVGFAVFRLWVNAGQAEEQLQVADQALAAGDFAKARELAESSLFLHNVQSLKERAWYVAGTAFLRDMQLHRSQRLPKAMEHLGQIPRQSPWFPKSALALANDKLFEAKSPLEANSMVDDALMEWPNDMALNNWKIVWLTVCHAPELAEPYFLAGARASKQNAEETELLLRTWLRSQFCPEQIETDFDRQLGGAGTAEFTNDTIRLERWTTLRRWNLADPRFDAAITHWYLKRGLVSDAMEQMHLAREKAEHYPDPMFLFVAIQVFCETGQLENARQVLQPLRDLAPGFLSKVSAARVALAQNDTKTAILELEAAQQLWPGPIDPWISQSLERIYRDQTDQESLIRADQLRHQQDRLQTLRTKLQELLALPHWEATEVAAIRDLMLGLNRTAETGLLAQVVGASSSAKVQE